MGTRTAPDAIPEWIPGLFAGEAPRTAERLGWGFRNETWAVATVDGRRLAITRLHDSSRGPGTVALITAATDRLATARVPVPAIIDLDHPEPGIIATAFVDGSPAAALISAPGGPALVGRLMGTVWQRLGSIDVAGLPLGTTWSDPAGLAATANRHLAHVAPALAGDDARRVEAGIAELPGWLRGRSIGFVHGDFAPVNVLVHGGAVSAVVDFEDARIANPLLDAAWFRWIVRYHHPEVADEAWQAFAAASGVESTEPSTDGLIRTLPAIRILEILATDELTEGETGHWHRMLHALLADRGGP